MPSLKHNEVNPPHVIVAALRRSLTWVKDEALRDGIEQHIEKQKERVAS